MTSARERPMADRVQSYIERELQVIDLIIRPSHSIADTRHLLETLFPARQNDTLQIHQEQDGVTNTLLRCTYTNNNDSKDILLVRIYGNATESMIYRDREIRNFVSLHLRGYAPKLLKRFKNGLVYEFVPGRVLSRSEMAEPKFSKAVARLLAAWHRDMPRDAGENQFWSTLQTWIAQMSPGPDDPRPVSISDVRAILNTPQRQHWLQMQLSQVQKFADSISQELVFSHNDLLHANIIVMNEAEEQPEVTFIDYEYGCTNDMHFDLANHFLEFAGFECDWTQLPNDDLKHTFVQAYLESSLNSTSISVTQIEATLNKVEAFFCVSHFYWGVWALLQASKSEIEFDYQTYGELKLEAFYREKVRLGF